MEEILCWKHQQQAASSFQTRFASCTFLLSFSFSFLLSSMYPHGADCWLLQLHNRFHSRLVHHHHHTFKYVDIILIINGALNFLSLHSFYPFFVSFLFPLINRRYAKINRFIHFGDIPSQHMYTVYNVDENEMK